MKKTARPTLFTDLRRRDLRTLLHPQKALDRILAAAVRSTRAESGSFILLNPNSGLLYRIACAIADAEMNIASARITTEKGAALDTFYLTDRHGRKIEDDETLATLIEEVRKRISAA